jgi:putative nucleotidyltransferase with HDIG domain
MTKRILINQLRPGMSIVGIDKSWWQTPFVSHKWTVQDPKDIQTLREVGVREVVIDLEHGCDVENYAATPVQEETLTDAVPTTPGEPACVTLASPLTLHTIAAKMSAARAVRNKILTVMEGIFEGVKIGKPVNSSVLKHAVVGLLDSVLHRSEAILILIQMQRFETTLLTHAVDVCVLALLLGVQQGLSEKQLETLGVGALLHDIGKTRLPRNVLRKTGESGPQVQKLRQEHPRLGCVILTNNEDLDPEVLRIVMEHHERANGSGFPVGHTAEKLSPLSQLVGLVNVYDDLVSGQLGGPVHQPTQALRRLYQLGKDGAFVDEHIMGFIRMLGVYPIGAVVEFNTRERGLVIATNTAESQKPLVLVVTDNNGRPFSPPRLVNLSERASDERVETIIRPLEATAIPTCLADYFKETV